LLKRRTPAFFYFFIYIVYAKKALFFTLFCDKMQGEKLSFFFL